MERPLSLLRDRVVDAWIGAYQPDLPGPDDPEFCVVDLLRETVFLVASPTHPLAGEGCLSAGDLERFPSMALPTGMLPKTEERYAGRGCGMSRCAPVGMTRPVGKEPVKTA